MKKTLILIITIILTTNLFSQKSIIESNNDFSFKIYNATKPDSGNFFISPFSLNIALSIANEGARTSTRQEMDSLLSIRIRNINDRALEYNKLIQKTTDLYDSNFKNCIEWSADKTSKNEIFLANSMWIHDDVDIDARFIENLKQNYKSEIFSFHKHNVILANKQLNDWISRKTNRKIPEIKGLNKDIMLSIVNAIYFMGEWGCTLRYKKD